MDFKRVSILINLAAIATVFAPELGSAQPLADSPKTPQGYAPLQAPYLTPSIPVTPSAIASDEFDMTVRAMGDGQAALQNYTVNAPYLDISKAAANPTSDIIPGQSSSDARVLEQTTQSSPELAQAPANNDSYSRERRRYENRQYRSGYSYIGIGGTIGTSGENRETSVESSLGEAGGTIFGRVAFTENFSFRPSLIIGDGTTITLPFTYDWSISRAPYNAPIALFLGGGFGLDLKNGNHGPLISTGIDIPFRKKFTFNATVDAALFEEGEWDWGLTLGVGYNFPGLISR
ncbi:hypothetical protein [Roseofilum casamattae]|uniref:Outer membrane protein beta-barrel domain-containing protein n=1 Tax=Roseofilum casamattae BLCC-M143 TaxID=3022442 RepID=A0ABT7BWZ1_9CYAN|nr:hypothetical protein [Roseofilum casamattae]MDJ1183714.1 hypothetical protein [Roseofilum casamattae BLCC-M143]